MNTWKTIVGLIVTSVLSANLYAQSLTCEEQLNEAQAEFEAGRFYSIPGMLKGCIDRGFSDEQRQRAFLLLTQTYLLMQDPIGAENSYLKVLEANPEYETNPDVDPIDVVYLSKKFTAAPIFSIYGKGGANISIARVINEIYLNEKVGSTPKDEYAIRTGWQAGVGLDWTISPRLGLATEVNLFNTSYRRTRSGVFGRDILESTEQQYAVSCPLLFKYTHVNNSNIKPYGYVGYAANLLLSARLKVIAQNRDENPDAETDNVSTENYESPNQDFKRLRTPINHSILVGGGARLKRGLNYLFVDVRYAFGLTNIINKDRVFQSSEITTSGYVDDFLRLDNLSLSVGFVYPIYKPRAVKRVRTKGILRKIKKRSNEE